MSSFIDLIKKRFSRKGNSQDESNLETEKSRDKPEIKKPKDMSQKDILALINTIKISLFKEDQNLVWHTKHDIWRIHRVQTALDDIARSNLIDEVDGQKILYESFNIIHDILNAYNERRATDLLHYLPHELNRLLLRICEILQKRLPQELVDQVRLTPDDYNHLALVRSKIEMPIRGTDIPGFREWIIWNWKTDTHSGYDFAAYLNTSNQVVIGLPPGTPVRAVARGKVSRWLTENRPFYQQSIDIGVLEHDKDLTLSTSYTHVVPRVKAGQKVKKGQIIATLYEDMNPFKEKYKHLVHLHFEAHYKFKKIDPLLILPKHSKLVAKKRASKQVEITGLGFTPEIIVANWTHIWGLQ